MHHDALSGFQPAVRRWFSGAFSEPTAAQVEGWPRIARGEHTLILAPTGSGKTLAAFLACLDRVMFEPVPEPKQRCRVLYISPLKALAVDVERNLRAPLAGISNEARRAGETFHLPSVGIRTGDTPASERARLIRQPTDILVSTPESVYLLLTSNARELLRSVRWVIVDEIHAMAASKRGAHLALSLERLEALMAGGASLQRIGLSATQRPLDEVARFLGGGTSDQAGVWRPREVSIVDVGSRKPLELRVEVPVEDMAKLAEVQEVPSGPAAQGPVRGSIWPAIHPRLLELIRQHRSTLIFVNSRRLAERVAAAVNELAGETLVYAHHGAIAREQRLEIEDALKLGRVPALVATSSLELGIDMGAIDLVVQIEAPPSVASGMQRIGRGGHQVGVPSKGVIFPKFRGDLLACAAITESMQAGRVEASQFPRNPLDVLAQQIVAMVSMDDWAVDDLYVAVRRAAPFAELTRAIFESVLDMLSGRYPADDFGELRPRLTWDRLTGQLNARDGARRLAVINGGTIPDRGLYGVFLATGAEGTSARVGELDEEMVFETRVGETFLLGASTWRVEEITHDRVMVSPAPGEPGKMPFWHGDMVGRPIEFGRSIGALVRELRSTPRQEAVKKLVEQHALQPGAAENLLRYLEDQEAAGSAIPDDQTIVVERCRDELGDWRVMILSPHGSRVHAPWALAIEAAVADRAGPVEVGDGLEIETMWSDDGIILRFPDAEQPPDIQRLLPAADEISDLVTRRLISSALFAARFRETASRALLLPRRRPGARAPLWQQRKRAADLLKVATSYSSFPMLLETYRECLQDVFDLPGLIELLRRVEQREVRLTLADTDTPSPFAASLLFNYVANYIYEGDAPVAERRAQALAVDPAQLRELLGEAGLRELIDGDALAELELRLQALDPTRKIRTPDALHDLLLRLGDLRTDEIAARSVDAAETTRWLNDLERQRRVLQVPLAGEIRWIAVEDAARYRDALGAPLPLGLADAFLEPVRDPLGDLAGRYARTHGPFKTRDIASRLGLGEAVLEPVLRRLEQSGRLLQGEFRPGGSGREWCDPEVLRQLRQRSLARLRHEVEPVEPAALGRLLQVWQGLGRSGSRPDDLLEVVEQLQGAAIPASVLETDVLPARLPRYRVGDLDQLCAAGEVVWLGLEPLGERDGRVALYLTDKLPLLRPTARPSHITEGGGEGPQAPIHQRLRQVLAERGAQFFVSLMAAVGATWPNEVLDALWDLVWAGEVTNDSLAALRAYMRPPVAVSSGRRGRRAAAPSFRSRRAAPPAAAGRWSLVRHLVHAEPSGTERTYALTSQLLERYGVLTREAVAAEGVEGGFSAVYPVLKAMEQGGQIRRGYFVAGRGATQFASPAAVERLRALRDRDDEPTAVAIAATDPANPYGAALRWPDRSDGRAASRSAGALVVLVDGELAAYLGRGERALLTWPPEDSSRAQAVARCVAEVLAGLIRAGRLAGLLLANVDGQPAGSSWLVQGLEAVGFRSTSAGYVLRPESPSRPNDEPSAGAVGVGGRYARTGRARHA